MSFFDSLFDSGQQKVETNLPAYIEDPSKEIGSRINALIRSKNQTQMNPLMQGGLNSIIQTAQQGNPFLNTGTDFLNSLFGGGGLAGPQAGLASNLISGGQQNPAMSEMSRIAYGGDLGANPFLTSTFNRAAAPVGENFKNNILSELDNSYAQTGRSGGLRYAQERNNAEQTYGNQINDLANQIFGGQYNAEQGRRDQALQGVAGLGQQNIANQLSGANLYQQGTQNLFGALQQGMAMDPARYADALRLFQAGQTQQQQPWQALQTGAGLLNSLHYPQSQTTSQTVPALAQTFGMLAGAAGLPMPSQAGAGGATTGGGSAGGALLAALMASDRRLKWDVKPYARLPNGLMTYLFRYLGSAAEQLGVMADEVVQVIPDAVHDRGGVLMVDYAKVA